MTKPFKCTVTLKSSTDLVYSEPARGKNVPGSIDNDRLRRLTRQWLTDRIARPDENGCSEREIQLLGRHLFETLFHDQQIRSDFEGLVTSVRDDPDASLCVQLIFLEDAAELARLPWEFLYMDLADGREWFLAGEVQFVLTRFMPSQVDLPAQVLPRPLKILIAACTTEVKGTADESFTIEEIKGLVELLARHSDDQSHPDAEIDVHIQRLADPTYSQLKDAIQGLTFQGVDEEAGPWLPDVVHVIGHGEPGAILLRRDEEAIKDDQILQESARLLGVTAPSVAKDEAVGAGTLAGLFDPHRPRFAFLQTCYSSAIDGAELYATSQRIVAAGVPAVLAMQYDIDRGAADKFAVRVYEELLAGQTIGTAVSAGRRVLRLRDSGAGMPYRAFGTPVVYLGSDGALLAAPRPRSRNSQDKQVPQPAEVVPRECPRCRATCRYANCATCGLYIQCASCGTDLENPLGVMCGACRAEIDQPPWRQEPPSEKTTISLTGAKLKPVSLSTGGSSSGRPGPQRPPEESGPGEGGGYPA